METQKKKPAKVKRKSMQKLRALRNNNAKLMGKPKDDGWVAHNEIGLRPAMDKINQPSPDPFGTFHRETTVLKE